MCSTVSRGGLRKGNLHSKVMQSQCISRGQPTGYNIFVCLFLPVLCKNLSTAGSYQCVFLTQVLFMKMCEIFEQDLLTCFICFRKYTSQHLKDTLSSEDQPDDSFVATWEVLQDRTAAHLGFQFDQTVQHLMQLMLVMVGQS